MVAASHVAALIAALCRPKVVLGQSYHELSEPIIDGCYFRHRSYRGDSLPGPIVDVKDYKECQFLCQRNTRCYYSTYIERHRHCWLNGKDAVFDNKGAHGMITGPKYCQQIPAGCTELPDPGFPGSNPDESEKMWPSHRVPDKMECWPRNSSKGWYDTCPQLTTLEDSDAGWPGVCTGLYEVRLKYGQDCRTECVKQTWCSVYVVVNNSAQTCWHGEGVNCYQRENFPGVVRAQRVMHGEVRVLANITGVQVFGLRRAFDQNFFVDQQEEAVKACRNDCYSNIECQYWQYSRMFGCYVENPNLKDDRYLDNSISAGVVPYPPSKKYWKPSRWGFSFIAGEYIQHVCPGYGGVPKHFSESFVPKDLQYARREDYRQMMIDNMRAQFPDVQAAPAKIPGFARLDDESSASSAAARAVADEAKSAGSSVLIYAVASAGMLVAFVVGSLRFARSDGYRGAQYRAQNAVEILSTEA
eukprot:TRINITY_DN14354_c0_g1_i1.p1 TRINITY_DN14354_c0_g1~~TRINITY_DN14354_c0_g1_i1.p1  ORF type:complete len:471 (-),score=84.53 TRINITY_DN14354_c0_g1_i1:77-1489(-)